MSNVYPYVQYADELRKEILSGRYGWEGGLPGISELTRRSGLKANTIYRSLAILMGEHLIIQRDQAYYVRLTPIIMTQYVGAKDYYKNLGTTGKVSPLPQYLQEKLQVLSSTVAVFRTQVSGRTVDGREEPIQVSYRYHFIPLTDQEVQQMADNPLYDPLWSKGEYATTLLSHDEVVSRRATEEERDLLDLPEDATVSHLFEVIRSMDGKILMAQEVVVNSLEALVFDFPFENKPTP
jgi:DNA-binding GntR family transcriptional regulator